jgi:16S rRNA (cytosine1402-N4)-methyltransferase
MIDYQLSTETAFEPEEFFMSADPRSPGYHEPVLLRETIDLLQPAPGRIFFEGTMGGGGHTRALLDAGATVIATDQDPEAIAAASAELAGHGDRLIIRRANFSEVGRILAELGIGQVHGALFDLGVSSHQFNTPERGFSLQYDGALDMRMSPDSPQSAADLVNTAGEEELARIFRDLGDEPAARRIASRIVRERARMPITRTLQLADLVASVIPRKGRTHPATRVFMALRMAVNRELEVLTTVLSEVTRHLAPGGRLAVISFHSGEDRIVKTFMKERATEWLDRPEWPAPRRNPAHIFRLLTTRPLVASAAEQKANPRARSAKLRVAERLPYARQ